MRDGVQAKLAQEKGLCTEAVENVIEANILLSGLGFENTGCAGAHAIHIGLSEISSAHSFLDKKLQGIAPNPTKGKGFPWNLFL